MYPRRIGGQSEIINRWKAEELGVTVSIQLFNELECTLKDPGVAKYLISI